MDENSDNMHILYIQKQEQLLLENIRMRMDYEIKLHIMNEKVNQSDVQLRQLQYNLEQQQTINSQALSSFERVSEENRALNLTINNLNEKIVRLEESSNKYVSEHIELIRKNSENEKIIKDLKTEINRQNEELTKLYNDSKSSKKKQKQELLQETNNSTF